MRLFFSLSVILPLFVMANRNDSIVSHWNSEIQEVTCSKDSVYNNYVIPSQIFEEGWNELAHPNFWKRIMVLSPDSCLINIGKTRQVITSMKVEDWENQSDEEKNSYRDSVRLQYGLNANDKVFMTSGKSDFYHFEKVFPTLAKGVHVFDSLGVDPWYAQAILLIESPGKLAKSNVGAYGAFQLMKGVARSHGLRVDKYVDERKDFTKSAMGASSLITKTCIPHAKRILTERGLEIDENALWFRLFVLHIYHAGAYNVEAVVDVINPSKSGPELIQAMWVNRAAKFKNSSQNYSQLALASLITMNDMLQECDCQNNL